MTLTWVPQGAGDPVPSVVVLLKEATASWSGGSGGSCANGLGHPPVGGSGGQVSTGVAYEVVQSPTSPIVRSITPSASVNSPQGTDVGAAAVLVRFSSIVPKIDFAGTTPAPIQGGGFWQNILIGQRLTSTANLGGLPQGSQDSFTWSASHGGPFNGYMTTGDVGTYHAFSPPNAPSAGWHFAKGEYGDPALARDGLGSTVTCNVVLREPEPDLQFTLSRDLRVFEPLVMDDLTFLFGTVQLFWDPLAPTSFGLFGLPLPNGNEAGAIRTAGLKRISLFDLPGPPPDEGKWGVFQLAVGRHEWQRASDPLRKNAGYGLWGLDLGVPYNGQSGTYALDEQFHVTSDTPHINVVGVSGTFWANIDYEFATELMYRPPRGDSVWVPLTRPRGWFAKGTATNTPPWGVTGAAQGFKPAQFPVRYFFNWTRSAQDSPGWVPPWP